MTKKAPSGIPAATLELYDQLVRGFPEIERKGASMPYTSLNGHMFSFLTPTGLLALRLPEDERDRFLETYDSKLCEQHGRVMKEYVEVPAELLRNAEELTPFFELSVEYVRSFKPKPTTRKKTVGKKKVTKTRAIKRKAK